MPPQQFKVPMSRPDIGIDEIEAATSVLKSGWPTQGQVTEKFESMLSRYLSSEVCAINSGSSAILCALLSHGLKPGDKVAVPAFTFVATSSVPKMLGARIVVVDSDPDTLNVDMASLETALKRHGDIKFVITVDVAGMPCDIDALAELARRYRFTLIEDAAESFGARYKNKPLGSHGITTIFSFQIAKQITTIEGGCISTLDKKLLHTIKKVRDYGRSEKERYVHDIVGANFRTTDFQSAIGTLQLKKVDAYIANRNRAAKEYRARIKGGIRFQEVPDYVSKHSYMLFFGLAKNKKTRDQLVKRLTSQGIDARKSWTPIHMQPCNPELHRFRCKNAEQVFGCAFTLPIYNSITMEETSMVIDACHSAQEAE